MMIRTRTTTVRRRLVPDLVITQLTALPLHDRSSTET